MKNETQELMPERAKRISRHKITFEQADDIEAVILAELGFSNRMILSETKLTECQINYRLKKAKDGFGFKKGMGFRQMYRNGISPVATQIIHAFKGDLRREVVDVLPRKFK